MIQPMVAIHPLRISDFIPILLTCLPHHLDPVIHHLLVRLHVNVQSHGLGSRGCGTTRPTKIGSETICMNVFAFVNDFITFTLEGQG